MLFILVIVICAVIGILTGLYFTKSLLTRSSIGLASESVQENVDLILKNAYDQHQIILDEALLASKEKYQADTYRLDAERKLLIRLQDQYDLQLNEKQSECDLNENDLVKKEKNLIERAQEKVVYHDQIQEVEKKKEVLQQTYDQQLELRANIKRITLKDKLFLQMIDEKKLETTGWQRDFFESLKIDAQLLSREALNAVYLRYQPNFIWPKASFIIQSASQEIIKKYFQEEDSPIIATLIENSDCHLSLLSVNEQSPSIIKITGGAGTDKEVIRLSIEEMIQRNVFHPERIKVLLEKHKRYIDRYVLKLGEDAFKTVGLKDMMHTEILKLIGSLNYRTSHRQNQYYHSIEVARLAGLIANELGVNADIAKRAGILHDIGKVLDYKIEGSHAVISADYALRYGESEDVVDTILSHHDDKIVETSYAYILKAADAMSGARPGARVDMEEGYHRRIDGISNVVNSFQELGVTGTAIMHAGREVHIFVDSHKVKYNDIFLIAENIAKKLEAEVEYPGQIRVTVIRRTEITEVA